MSVRLFVRDNSSGTVHEYGTNQHDALLLMEDGSIHYENLQNMTGTMFPEEGYSFCCSDGTYPLERDDFKEYGFEPFLDIGGEKPICDTGCCPLRERLAQVSRERDLLKKQSGSLST